MFNVRFGYYLGAICIFSIILWYDGIKNTLFRKNNTRLHILGGMIGILIITLPAIFLIFNLPPTYNRIIKTVTGEVVKYQCVEMGYFNDLETYSIILDDKDTNKIYKFPEIVGVADKLKKGDEIEIRFYEFLGVQSRMIATVYKGNIIKNLIMDCQSYTKYRPNETTGGIFVSWRRKEELPTGA